MRTIAVDFTENRAIYPKIRAELTGLEIGLLVNNVGMILDCGPFAESCTDEDDRLSDVINCNVNSLVRMTHLVLPGMIRRKRGLIINVGSLLGTGSSPMYALYGATKSFLAKFSQDLAVEMRPEDGVVVLTVLPGLVATSMPGADVRPSLVAPTAEAFVESSIRSLGIESRSAPYWVHKILVKISFFISFFPEFDFDFEFGLRSCGLEKLCTFSFRPCRSLCRCAPFRPALPRVDDPNSFLYDATVKYNEPRQMRRHFFFSFNDEIQCVLVVGDDGPSTFVPFFLIGRALFSVQR